MLHIWHRLYEQQVYADEGEGSIAAAAELDFEEMTEAELRQWVEANSGRVNDRDSEGDTPLIVAAADLESLSLVMWLLDEKGADVDAITENGVTALHVAGHPDIVTALIDRGADPILLDCDDLSPIMGLMQHGSVEAVARLLQDPRVRATINMQNTCGRTLLHRARWVFDVEEAA